MSGILIVDDDPHIRELARAFLRSDGFEVYEASDGVEALERIARGDFDVQLNDNFRWRENELPGDLVKSVNQTALELGRLEQMRREFVSNVSHEIQSPLTSIRGFAQALRDDGLPREDKRYYLTIIETESTRLSRLTENLLQHQVHAGGREHPGDSAEGSGCDHVSDRGYRYRYRGRRPPPGFRALLQSR